MASVTPIKSPSQTPPRVMSRDDRRVIIAEVKGCYDEENKRYMDGWHDEKVAQALGAHVPVGWVKEVREDYFGEGASNEQFDEVLKLFAKYETEIKRVELILAAADVSIQGLKKAADDMAPTIKDVRRAIGK